MKMNVHCNERAVLEADLDCRWQCGICHISTRPILQNTLQTTVFARGDVGEEKKCSVKRAFVVNLGGPFADDDLLQLGFGQDWLPQASTLAELAHTPQILGSSISLCPLLRISSRRQHHTNRKHG
jgi:hypothetical protein